MVINQQRFKLKSGIRQGCPMSRPTFTLQLNPLLVFLNTFSGISKYKSLSNKEFLTLTFMDDGNFFTQSLSSVINSLFYIRKFKHASGLEINMSKSVGKFYNLNKISIKLVIYLQLSQRS